MREETQEVETQDEEIEAFIARVREFAHVPKYRQTIAELVRQMNEEKNGVPRWTPEDLVFMLKDSGFTEVILGTDTTVPNANPLEEVLAPDVAVALQKYLTLHLMASELVFYTNGLPDVLRLLGMGTEGPSPTPHSFIWRSNVRIKG